MEILGAEKMENVFQLIYTLFCMYVKWREVLQTLKNCSFEVNYLVKGGDQPFFKRRSFPLNICSNILVQVSRFLWSEHTQTFFQIFVTESSRRAGWPDGAYWAFIYIAWLFKNYISSIRATFSTVKVKFFLRRKNWAALWRGQLAQWTSHSPQEQKTRVRIPPG
jgi:hypothetical protein